MRLPKLLSKMERDWDARARENFRYYIATAKTDWAEQEFLETGRTTIEQCILTDLWNVCGERDPKQMRVLEIGCGAGRLTKALAEVFGEVHGVDVSGEMISEAQNTLKETANAFVYRNNGMDLTVLPDVTFDFAFSYLVFQHIPSQVVMQNYFHEVSRRLQPGSLFKLQVNGCLGRPPRNDTWLGIPLSKQHLIAMAEGSGFEVRFLVGEGTLYFWAWLFKR